MYRTKKRKNKRLKTLLNIEIWLYRLYLMTIWKIKIHLQSRTIRDVQNSLNYNYKKLLKKPISDMTVTELKKSTEVIYKGGKSIQLWRYLPISFTFCSNYASDIAVDEKIIYHLLIQILFLNYYIYIRK